MALKRRFHKNRGIEAGRFASTEEELYKKAIELLDKCKFETRRKATLARAPSGVFSLLTTR